MENADRFLLWYLFIIQLVFAVRLRCSTARLPFFEVYLWVCLTSFFPWALYAGPDWTSGSYWGVMRGFPAWSVFVSVLKGAVAIEALWCLTKSHAWRRSFCLSVAAGLLVVLWFIHPTPYPNYPKGEFYVRLVGNCFAVSLPVIGLLYSWFYQAYNPWAVKRHGVILAVYFGGMLANDLHLLERTASHTLLMSLHMGCFFFWHLTLNSLSAVRNRRDVGLFRTLSYR